MPCWREPILAAVLALSIMAVAQRAEAEAIGQIKTLAGEVYLLRATVKTPARAGDWLETADTLMTGADGRAGVTFIDNSRFSVGPDSQIALETFTFNATTKTGSFHTRMERGTLAVISGAIAHTSPEAMKIHTRASILGVRGTHFLVKVDE